MTRLVVVVASILASVAVASAECAWVLWQESEIKMPDKSAEIEWADPIAYSDRAACVAVINDHVKRWEEEGSPMLRAERTRTETTAESRSRFKSGEGWTAVRFRCLPDTVDPRAK